MHINYCHNFRELAIYIQQSVYKNHYNYFMSAAKAHVYA